VSTAAVEFAKAHVGTILAKSVLVIGAGKMGALAAKRLKLEGATEISVINRSHDRARSIIAELGVGRAIEMPGLVEAMQTADIVITSTGASHFILSPGNVAEAMLARPNRPLTIIDIAVPRDVDPEVARIPGVHLVDIDALKHVVEDNLEHRREAIPLVEDIISEHAERFHQWYQSRVAVPIISSLTKKAEAIRDGEVERLFSRCTDLTDRERMLITGMSLTIISKLLHTAVVKIRDKAVENRAEAMTHALMLNELFDLRTKLEEAAVPVLAIDADHAE
jgi:glutamyl-tRNA reductase